MSPTPMDLVPLTLFCFTMTVTPGPNNIVLTATGANHGYRSCLPHILGALVSLPVMCVLVGAGLGRLFLAWPALHAALDVVGSAYMLWLAWKITRFSGQTGLGRGDAGEAARPLTFGQAAVFQWLNPKCWMMYIGAVSLFTTGGAGVFSEVLVIAALFAVMVPPCFSAWALLGAGVGRFLNTRLRVLAFNWTLALALVGSLVLAHLPQAG